MILAKLIFRFKKWGAVALAAIAAFYYARMKKAQADTHKTRADFAQRNTTAAEKRTERLISAQDAARIAGVEGQEELENEKAKFRRGGVRRDRFE